MRRAGLKSKQIVRDFSKLESLALDTEHTINLKSVFYETEGGARLNRQELIARNIAARTPQQRDEFLAFVSTLTRVEKTIGSVPYPPKGKNLPDHRLTQDELLNALSETGVPTLAVNFQQPLMENHFDTFPMPEDTAQLVIDAYADSGLTVVSRKIPEKYRDLPKFQSPVLSQIKGEVKPMVTLRIPIPYPKFNDMDHRRMPTYYWKFYVRSYDVSFMRTFAERIQKMKFAIEAEEARKVYMECYSLLPKTYFGNGSVMGMLARLKSMMDQREFLKNRYKKQKHDINALARYFKTNVIPPSFDDITLINYTEKNYTKHGKEIPIEYALNSSANAGPLYNGVKYTNSEGENVPYRKGDTVEADFNLASELLLELHSIMREAEGSPVQKFFEKFSWLRLFNCFPKGEVYLRDEYATKTRMIASYNTAPMILPGLILQMIGDNLDFQIEEIPTNTLNGKVRDGRLIAAKLSLVSGASNRFLDVVHSVYLDHLAKKYYERYFVFADNIYVIKSSQRGTFWASLDLKKAESSITPKFISDVMQLFLGDLFRDVNIAKPSLVYLTKIFPNIAAAGVAIMANQQINFPAMGSGVQGTFLFNSAKSAQIVTEHILGKTFMLNDDFSMSRDLEETAGSCGAIVTMDGGFQYQPNEKYYAADLIGYDFALFDVDPLKPEELYNGRTHYFALLSKERLMKMLLYNKNHYDENGEFEGTPAVREALNVIKLKSAVFFGAWYYPELYETCMLSAYRSQEAMRTDIAYARLEEMEQDEIRDGISILLGDSELVTPEVFASLVTESALPTLYDLCKLHVDKEFAKLACLSRVNLMPLQYLFPYPVALELGFGEALREELSIPLSTVRKSKSYYLAGVVPTSVSKPRSMVSIKNPQPLKSTLQQEAPLAVTKPQERKVPTKDVGKPIDNTPKPKSVTPGKIKQEEVNRFIKFLNDELSKGSYYRVPVPSKYLGMKAELRDEENTARRVFVLNVAARTGLDKDEVHQMVNTAAPLVKFYMYKTKEHEKPSFIKQATKFDLADSLVPGKVIDREILKS